MSIEPLAEFTPPDRRAFERWIYDCIVEIEPLIVADEFGDSTLAAVAKVVRKAKAHAYRLGMYSIANGLPERPFKTPLDGLLRLRECLEAPARQQPDGPMTVQQTATWLGISERTVRALIAGNELGHHRVGNGRGQVRILPSDIENYQRRSETPGFRHLFRQSRT